MDTVAVPASLARWLDERAGGTRAADPAEHWQTLARCREADPEVFFSDYGDGHSLAQAKRVCRRCEVRRECLADSLARREWFGTWGGLSEWERRRVLTGDSGRWRPRT